MQNNITMLKPQKEFSIDLTNGRFGMLLNEKELTRDVYFQDIESAYTAGALGFIQELFKEDYREEYKSKDEMMGDIQLAMIELFNHFRKRNSDKNIKEITLDDFLSGGFRL